MTYREWCLDRGVMHAHCPEDCENPQPFIDDAGDLICGLCAVQRGQRSVMIPCTPETCDD